MVSTDKCWAIFWVSLFTCLTLVVFMLTSAAVTNAPRSVERTRIEAQIKVACLSRGGNWSQVNSSEHDDPVFGCKMK